VVFVPTAASLSWSTWPRVPSIDERGAFIYSRAMCLQLMSRRVSAAWAARHHRPSGTVSTTACSSPQGMGVAQCGAACLPPSSRRS
jgi:hypothetical protein